MRNLAKTGEKVGVKEKINAYTLDMLRIGDDEMNRADSPKEDCKGAEDLE